MQSHGHHMAMDVWSQVTHTISLCDSVLRVKHPMFLLSFGFFISDEPRCLLIQDGMARPSAETCRPCCGARFIPKRTELYRSGFETNKVTLVLQGTNCLGWAKKCCTIKTSDFVDVWRFSFRLIPTLRKMLLWSYFLFLSLCFNGATLYCFNIFSTCFSFCLFAP